MERDGVGVGKGVGDKIHLSITNMLKRQGVLLQATGQLVGTMGGMKCSDGSESSGPVQFSVYDNNGMTMGKFFA